MSAVLGNTQAQREMLEWAGGWREDLAMVNTSIVMNKGVEASKQS